MATLASLIRILTHYANVPAKEAAVLAAEVEEQQRYDTEAELLAATPPAGTLGYALDTEALWLRKAASWAAAGSGGGSSVADVATGNIVLAVATTGSDTPTIARPAKLYSGDYSATPFATIQAALDALPKTIPLPYTVAVNVGAGNFAGFMVRGFATQGASTLPAALQVTGTRVQSTPATGPATGTATAGTSRGLTLTGAGWTTDDLVGRFVRVSAGTGVGQILTIAANSADEIVCTSVPSPALNGTSQFVIEEPATVIVSPPLAQTKLVIVQNNTGPVTLSDMKLSAASTGITSILLGQYTAALTLYRFVVLRNFASESVGLSISSVTAFVATQCAVLGATSSAVLNLLTTANLVGLLAKDGNTVLTTSGCPNANWTVYVRGATTRAIQATGTRLALNNSVIDACAKGVELFHNTSLTLTNVEIKNTTNPFVLEGNAAVRQVGTLVGAGNTGWGMNLRGVGNTLSLAGSTPTIAGTSGEITVDGSTDVTWAALAVSGDYAVDVASGARAFRA